jgi:hypothetical protein
MVLQVFSLLLLSRAHHRPLSLGLLISIASALPMVSDDTIRLAAAEAATALQQHVTDKMVALQVIEKKTVEAHAHVHAIALLLKEEHASAAALEAEVMATAL